jgi:hypothetical protein
MYIMVSYRQPNNILLSIRVGRLTACSAKPRTAAAANGRGVEAEIRAIVDAAVTPAEGAILE